MKPREKQRLLKGLHALGEAVKLAVEPFYTLTAGNQLFFGLLRTAGLNREEATKAIKTVLQASINTLPSLQEEA